MITKLRDYQYDAADGIMLAWQQHGATLLDLATGLGKTVVFSAVLKAMQPGRAMVLAHTEELIWQARNKLEEAGLRVEVEMAELKAGGSFYGDADVIVSTVQTQNSKWLDGSKRMTKFRPEDFSILVIDEAHHAAAGSYREIIAHYRQNPRLKVLGVSVGPKSFVELRGGCFGIGFVGEIESAFEIASKIQMPREWYDFQVIDLRGVYSRGWNGSSFGWHPCVRILRHAGKPCIKIVAQGATLDVTPDHSVYEVVAGPKARVMRGHSLQSKATAAIKCTDAESLVKGCILVGDDGADFGEWGVTKINMLDFCRVAMPQSRIFVNCDVRSIERNDLRHIANPNTIYEWRRAGAIPLHSYRLIESPPPAISLRAQGATGTISPVINLGSWAYILGFYLGDGWLSSSPSDYRLGFAVGNKQEKEITSALESLEGIKWTVASRKMPGKSVELRANNVFVATILRSVFGDVRCHNKFIPGEWIVGWNREQRLNLLRGLLDSDGAKCEGPQNRSRHVIVTTSEKLAKGICSLLRSMGLWGSIGVRKPCAGGVVGGRQITGRRQSYSIGWSDSPKSGHYGKRRKFVNGPLAFTEVPIRRIESSDAPSWVYDIEMSGHPSFVADGVLVHNTATPDRSDELALGEIFDCVAFHFDILDGINHGWLVPIEQQMVHIEGLDFSKMRTTAGDLNGADLIAVMEAEQNLQGVAGSSIKIIGNRRALVFAVSVKQAEVICEIFNRHKPNCARWVSGKTNKDERRETVAAFSRGDFQVLCNCNCFAEGFDVPGVEVIVVAKPTKSRTRYAQYVGRGTRALPGVVDGPETADLRRAAIAASGKPSMLVIDFCGNAGKHKLISAADILGGKSSADAVVRAKKKSEKNSAPLNVLEALKLEEEKLAEEKEERQRLERARKQRIVADVSYRMTLVDPFDRYAVKRQPPNPWEQRNGHALTERQRATLQKMGVNPDEISVLCGRKLLGARFNGPCSEAQAKVLSRAGYSIECSMKEASKLIDALAKNGWKRPEPETTPQEVNDAQPKYAWSQ